MAKSKRKPNNAAARTERYQRAVLRQFRVAVMNLDWRGKPEDEFRQYLVDFETGRMLRHGVHVAEAVCDLAHRWTVFLGVMCRDQNGKEYLSSSEFTTTGIHKADQLTETIEEQYLALVDSCNPKHVVCSGWVANPCQVSLTNEQATRLFETNHGWHDYRESANVTEPAAPSARQRRATLIR